MGLLKDVYGKDDPILQPFVREDYKITEYIHNKQEKQIKEDIIFREISYNGWDHYEWMDLFENIKHSNDSIFNLALDSGYKPLLSVYTPKGKYGYAKLDFYWAREDWGIQIIYEYMWKDEHVRKEYYTGKLKEYSNN